MIKFLDINARLSIPAPVVLRHTDCLSNIKFGQKKMESQVYCLAEVSKRTSGGKDREIFPYDGIENYMNGNEDVYYIGIPGFVEWNKDTALKVLEVLAYGVNDYHARESLCGRIRFKID